MTANLSIAMKVSGTFVPLASTWNYLQNCRGLVQLGEKLQCKFINYLCVMRQENNDFVSFILRDLT